MIHFNTLLQQSALKLDTIIHTNTFFKKCNALERGIQQRFFFLKRVVMLSYATTLSKKSIATNNTF